MPDLTIQVQDMEVVSVVRPIGFVNAHTVRHFEGVLEDLVGRSRFTILIDCAGLAYISSAGLGAIMGLVETVRGNRGDILLCSLQDDVKLIFDTLGFTELYRIFPDEAAAQESLAGRS